jgi:hypothetical protein
VGSPRWGAARSAVWGATPAGAQEGSPPSRPQAARGGGRRGVCAGGGGTGERRNLMSYNGLGMQKKRNPSRILHNGQDHRAGAVRRWRRCPQFPAGPPVAACASKRLFQARRSHQSRTAATGCLRGCGRAPPALPPVSDSQGRSLTHSLSADTISLGFRGRTKPGRDQCSVGAGDG